MGPAAQDCGGAWGTCGTRTQVKIKSGHSVGARGNGRRLQRRKTGRKFAPDDQAGLPMCSSLAAASPQPPCRPFRRARSAVCSPPKGPLGTGTQLADRPWPVWALRHLRLRPRPQDGTASLGRRRRWPGARRPLPTLAHPAGPRGPPGLFTSPLSGTSPPPSTSCVRVNRAGAWRAQDTRLFLLKAPGSLTPDPRPPTPNPGESVAVLTFPTSQHTGTEVTGNALKPFLRGGDAACWSLWDTLGAERAESQAPLSCKAGPVPRKAPALRAQHPPRALAGWGGVVTGPPRPVPSPAPLSSAP